MDAAAEAVIRDLEEQPAQTGQALEDISKNKRLKEANGIEF